MRVEANGITLEVLEAGDLAANHTALVFLHLFGGSSRSWTEVINRLSVHYRCIAPDLRGFGASDAPPGNYAVKDYAEDVAALIAAANIKNYVLVGHSMGGKIALALAARRPAALHSLVLLAPSPPTPEPIPDAERARLLATHRDTKAVEETLRKITTHPLLAAILHRTIEDSLRCSPAAWRAWLEAGSREDISAEVTRINVPVLVVAGAADEVMNGELLQREIVRHIAGAQLKTLLGVNHLLPLEDPAAIADLINDHCQQSFIPAKANI